MPRPSVPPEQSFPARAPSEAFGRQRREIAAIRLREEAADLDRRWAEFCAKREAQVSAKRNVKAKVSA